MRSPPPPPPNPGRKLIFNFFTANLGALLPPARQKCKQQQVSQRCKIRPQTEYFVVWKACMKRVRQKLHRKRNDFLRGLRGGVKIRISLFGGYQKCGISPRGGKVSPQHKGLADSRVNREPIHQFPPFDASMPSQDWSASPQGH